MARTAWRNGKPRRERDGPWLLWSHYHNAWHRRSETGGAAGYTTHIESAGIFDFATARAYHDWREGRNKAIPLTQVRAILEGRLTALAAVVATTTARLAEACRDEARDGATPQVSSAAKGTDGAKNPVREAV